MDSETGTSDAQRVSSTRMGGFEGEENSLFWINFRFENISASHSSGGM